MARTNAADKLARTENPKPGTVLPVPAGGRAEATFDFVNEAPFVAAFHVEVGGLPGTEWAMGAGPDAKMMAAASGGGTLTLTLCPPASAAIGDYPFAVKVISEGDVVGNGPIPLTLRVEPGVGPVEEMPPPDGPTVTRETIADPAPVVETSETPRDGVVSDGASTSSDASPRTERAVQETPAETRPTRRETGPEPVTTVKQDPPTEVVREPTKETTSEPRVRAKAEPIPRRPDPTPLTTPREEKLDLIDLPDEEEPEKEAPIGEPSLLDPSDGTALSLRPGETLLLRFSFTNDTRRERVFVIEEDRSLDGRWINIVQDQIHLMPNAGSELTVRLKPPPGAEPGSYPFQVRVGPTGGVLTPYNLTLHITATPAVRLKADALRVQAGPFARAVEFPLSVERAGNADTAFRVAVRAPRADTDEADAPRGTDAIYETAQWRYLFDREMANIESPAYGRTPKPEPIRLRVQRKGTWWVGFRESHRMRVTAVPVTDPNNGGKVDNTLDLTAVRWRLLPLPGFVVAPLALLILILLGGTARDLRVVNPTYEAPDGIHYVVGIPKNNAVTARLTWEAPWYALLRLSGGGEGGLVRPPEEIRAAFSESGERSVQREYRLTSPLGSTRSVKVRFVRARDDTPLEITGAQRTEEGTYRLEVPAGGATLALRNRAAQFNRINYWVAKRPGSDFVVSDLLNEGSLDPVVKGGGPLVVKVRPGGTGGQTDELVFVTTDSAHPVVVVKLMRTPGQ